jgi:hypothetical protein
MRRTHHLFLFGKEPRNYPHIPHFPQKKGCLFSRTIPKNGRPYKAKGDKAAWTQKKGVENPKVKILREVQTVIPGRTQTILPESSPGTGHYPMKGTVPGQELIPVKVKKMKSL